MTEHKKLLDCLQSLEPDGSTCATCKYLLSSTDINGNKTKLASYFKTYPVDMDTNEIADELENFKNELLVRAQEICKKYGFTGTVVLD
jgi:hypothetical protein